MHSLRLVIMLICLSVTSLCQGYQLTANDDHVAVKGNTSTNIAVLGNDFTDLDTGWTEVTLRVVIPPSYGVATLDPTKVIVLTPTTGFKGDDWFSYRIQARSGGIRRTSEATVYVSVKGSLQLKWNVPKTDELELITGAKVYKGPACDPNQITYFATLVADSDFPLADPGIDYMPLSELGVSLGDYVCFQVTWISASEESERSNMAGTTITKP